MTDTKPKKIKCCSVRYAEMVDFNHERDYFLLKLFNGKSVFLNWDDHIANDWEPQKSDAMWIPLWKAEKKGIDTKKVAWFENGKRLPTFSKKTFVPKKIEPKEVEIEASLTR